MKTLIVLVGPPGVGKSTYAKKYANLGFVYINQDSQGKQHLELFKQAVLKGDDIMVDRMNFSREQRSRYLDLAKTNGYTTEIVVLHESYKICLDRCVARQNHETIKNKQDAQSALNLFFSKYEKPKDNEADKVSFNWFTSTPAAKAIWCDLDGTLCNTSHRQHFMDGKKNWRGFFEAMVDDTVNEPVMETLNAFARIYKPEGPILRYPIVYCSGRPDNYREQTIVWLSENNAPWGELFMRLRNDQRPDNIVKEILLDFEVLTRYEVLFCLDDRDQVVKMLRDRGLTVFQVAEGKF